MALFSLRKLPSFLYDTGNFESSRIHFIISESSPKFAKFWCDPKIVKLSLDVNFGFTSWLSDLKISSSSFSIFSWYVFPPLTLLFCLCSAFASFEVLMIFVDVTDIHWGERSLSDSPSDWVKCKLFSTSVISSLSSSGISPTFDHSQKKKNYDWPSWSWYDYDLT